MTKEEMTHIGELAIRIGRVGTDAIETWGEDEQLRMFAEETAEASAEVNRFFRGRNSTGDLADEIADVVITLSQAVSIVGRGRVFEAIGRKLDRLEERIHETRVKRGL